MADQDTTMQPRLSRADGEACYWLGEFTARGLTLSQAEVLAWQPGVDRHAVREALTAARAKGTDASYVFDAFS